MSRLLLAIAVVFMVLISVFLLTLMLLSQGDHTEERVLSIFCFKGYAEPEWVNIFEEKYKCKVRITYTSTIEEMFEETQKAPTGYHLISIDSGRVQVYESAGLLQSFDTQRLDHLQNLDPYFSQHPYSHAKDGTTLLHVPIVWGTITSAINRDLLDADVIEKYLSPDGRSVSMDLIYDPQVKGSLAFFDEAANVFAIAAMHAGVDNPHNLSDDEWPLVEERIRKMLSASKLLTTGLDSEFSAISSNEISFLIGGNDALLAARLHEAGLADKFLQLPLTEGTHCWIDGWSMTKPTSGVAQELAYAWINYMTSMQGQKTLVEQTGFGPVMIVPSSEGSVASSKVPWYGKPLKNFPGALFIMAPEEDPLRRIERWQALKAAGTTHR